MKPVKDNLLSMFIINPAVQYLSLVKLINHVFMATVLDLTHVWEYNATMDKLATMAYAFLIHLLIHVKIFIVHGALLVIMEFVSQMELITVPMFNVHTAIIVKMVTV